MRFQRVNKKIVTDLSTATGNESEFNVEIEIQH